MSGSLGSRLPSRQGSPVPLPPYGRATPTPMPGTVCRAQDCSRRGGLRWEAFAFWCDEHGPGDEWQP